MAILCALSLVRPESRACTSNVFPRQLRVHAHTRVWTREQIPELKQIGVFFRNKFGNEFFKFVVAEDTAEKGGVPARVVMKLAATPPAEEYKVETLKAIGNEMGVAWHGT